LAQEEQPNFRPCRLITKEEVKETLRKMKVGNAVGPDNVPVEFGNLWMKKALSS